MIGTILQCPNVMCLYKWEYKGSSRFYASCPSCKYKVRIPKLTEQEISAGSAGESYTGSESSSTVREHYGNQHEEASRPEPVFVFVKKKDIRDVAKLLLHWEKICEEGCYLSYDGIGGILVVSDTWKDMVIGSDA